MSQKPRRRGFRFRLRTLLIAVTVLSVPLGWVGWRLAEVRREREAINWVKETGGNFDFQVYLFDAGTVKRTSWEATTEKWFGKRVRWIFLDGTQVIDLAPLAELKNLEGLTLRNTQVSDLSPLAELKQLELLHLSGTQVSDVSPLSELANLIELSLDNTQVNNLSPLAELKKLKLLRLDNTSVSDEQLQELRHALPNCRIHHSVRDQ